MADLMNERINRPAKVIDLTAEAAAHEGPGSKDQVMEKVDEYFKQAREALVTLTEPGDGKPTLPPEEVAEAVGLAFAFVNRRGALVSGMGGRGFLIRKLAAPDAEWSAPLFFTVCSVGVGLTLGFAHTESVILLKSDDAINGFLDKSTRFDPDVGVTGSEETPAPHAPRTAFKSVRSAGSREYAVASGMLVDASLKGGEVAVDYETMTHIYGVAPPPEDVLSGKVPPPRQAKILYNELHKILEGRPAALLPEP